jgi:hypothetical protein
MQETCALDGCDVGLDAVHVCAEAVGNGRQVVEHHIIIHGDNWGGKKLHAAGEEKNVIMCRLLSIKSSFTATIGVEKVCGQQVRKSWRV